MERKQGFIPALQVLSPLKCWSRKVTMPAQKMPPVTWIDGEALATVLEGPDIRAERYKGTFSGWLRKKLKSLPVISGACQQSDLRLLLGVMGAPLAPVNVCAGKDLHNLSINDASAQQETSSSTQFILHKYTEACGGLELLNSIQNSFATGKTKMSKKAPQKNQYSSMKAVSGRFVLWQMAPGMWFTDLAIGGLNTIQAGCDGLIAWRHAPCIGSEAAKAPARPLRRALQGLDPLTTASVFANAEFIGEKVVAGEDCLVLRLCADGLEETLRHSMLGYFSKKSGLLVCIEDSQLQRIQSGYRETTIFSSLEDYRTTDGGVTVAHSGRSAVTVFTFANRLRNGTKIRLEESWRIDEIAFNVPGLSKDCFFVPPPDLICG